MPPKTRERFGAKWSTKRTSDIEPGLGSRALLPEAPGSYLYQDLQENSKRYRAFIRILLDRLSTYEEDVDKIEDAFTNNTELPPPKLKKTATGSQSGDTGESNRSEKTLQTLQEKITELTTRNQDLDNKLKQTIHELSKRQSSATTRPASQRRAVIEDKHDSEQLEKDLEKLWKENAVMKADVERKTREIEQLQSDKSNHGKDRLRKMTGAQVVTTSPAIADLSDPNRPTRLGEKFSELYDSEWTDAMEELSNTIPNEKDVIQKLLRIVCDAYRFCRDRSDKFLDSINGTLGGFSDGLSSPEAQAEDELREAQPTGKSVPYSN